MICEAAMSQHSRRRLKNVHTHDLLANLSRDDVLRVACAECRFYPIDFFGSTYFKREEVLAVTQLEALRRMGLLWPTPVQRTGVSTMLW